jgi:UDP-2-acetamido-2,6-beta-L-arabino-hexul-4-ose reductase
MKILVTGANGFIGKNLTLRLRELPEFEVLPFVRSDGPNVLKQSVNACDAIVHLAGENRPTSAASFEKVNVGLTEQLCSLTLDSQRKIPIILTSSIQAEMNNPYGLSKLGAEFALKTLAQHAGIPVAIYRLPGVFGKWCKPNYNSVVATFCHNKAHDLPVQINDASHVVRLVYVDDVVSSFVETIHTLQSTGPGVLQPVVEPEYSITLGDLSAQIDAFKNCRTTLLSERVGAGLTRALYATYVSYLPKDKFVYDLPAYGDERGVFVEMLKTPDSGQFSFFTAHPGITRGGHYHHTKTEKFLVIKGRARFGFRHMLTNDAHTVETSGDKPQIVETVPGWTHDITNIGQDEMVVMLWANEIFDRAHPDTVTSKV